MTVSTLEFFQLPGVLFQKSSPNSQKLISFLTKVINDGYNLNKKYNVITSTRIKDEKMFINDLGFKNPNNVLYVLVKSKDHTLTDQETATLLKNNSILDIPTIIKDEDFNFDDISHDQILGSIGIKHIPDETQGKGWELTGFVSNAKGVGKYLIGKITEIAKAENQEYLFASVIYEHNLVPYYGQYGFVEYGERSLEEIDPDTGRVLGGSLEDGIYATQNFHVAFLKKALK